ncbi:hypothetical protein ACQP2P_29530 [Dactylosporangium sp. CA-139114]|uniref:hypothetical protein n=1 Tax=Dactylosporangium sp. CA-139114 TaxID=3239931 RepID=UPI003D97B8DF
MDIALALLIGLIAVYAGGVAALVLRRPLGPARALTAGAGTAAGVVAAFALMLLFAHVWFPGTLIVVALFAGAVAYLTLLRDLGGAKAGPAALLGALLTCGSFVFVSYLAVMAVLGAAGVYLVLRQWLRMRPALLLMGGTLGGLLAASAAVFAAALANM